MTDEEYRLQQAELWLSEQTFWAADVIETALADARQQRDEVKARFEERSNTLTELIKDAYDVAKERDVLRAEADENLASYVVASGEAEALRAEVERHEETRRELTFLLGLARDSTTWAHIVEFVRSQRGRESRLLGQQDKWRNRLIMVTGMPGASGWGEVLERVEQIIRAALAEGNGE